jgi:hypothetical protein
MLNNKLKIIVCGLVWGICAFFALSGDAVHQADEFVIEKESVSKNNKEKKYSELQEDLVIAYEELLRAQTQLLHDVADAQEQCLDALKKVVVNTPKMARVRIEKEVVRVNKQIESLKSVRFF